jgi:SAM-dependent methyltransferase
MAIAPDQFYTGLIAEAYAPLRGVTSPVAISEEFVRRYGEPALEIGCGHGEPLLDLIAAGLDVTGLDSSADMLALCEAEAARRHLQVTLVCQRMEAMEIDRQFASIYFAGPTFQLVVDPLLAAGALTRIGRHLLPEGRVQVPLFRPRPVPPAALGRWREHVTADGVELGFQTVDQSFRPEERRVDTTLQYRRGPADNPTEVVDRTWSLRWYEDGEFEDLAASSSLAVDEYDGMTYTLRRDRAG